MPTDKSQPALTTTDRLREVASIFARGVARWRNQDTAGRSMPDSGPENPPKIGLATCFETGLSGSLDTRGLRLRDDGDDA